MSLTVSIPTTCYGYDYGVYTYLFGCSLSDDLNRCSGTVNTGSTTYPIDMTR
jgi:hypothetical protein